MASVKDITDNLRRLASFESVEVNSTTAQLRILGRLPKSVGGVDPMPQWLLLVHRLVSAHDRKVPWSIDVSRRYFARGEKLVQAWRLIFQAEDMAAQYDNILETISNTPRAKVEVNEVPLVGASRGVNSRGKGAAGVFDAVVGPAALAQRGRGQ